MPECNKTHLSIDIAEDRQIVHRDYIAHCLRWSHVLRHVDIGETVLDLGCADGPMAMAFYTNKYKPKLYVGIDIRESILEKARKKLEKAPWATFKAVDLIHNFDKVPKEAYSIITSFEMVEHIPGETVEPLLKNVATLMNKDTKFFLSTPCYDGVNKASNHVKEWFFEELKEVLQRHFKIEAVYGTFGSQKDLKALHAAGNPIAMQLMSEIDRVGFSLWELLHEYYDSNFLATIWAPLFPELARNAIWRLSLKDS